jgi:hypothetical protein
MERLSHSKARLSMRLLAVAAVASGVALAGVASSTPPAGTPAPYYGRWTANEPVSHFSARGRLYKTIDIAPCGGDFCGVSVSDQGACGITLFRFMSHRRDGMDRLQGHGKWGPNQKNIVLVNYESEDAPGGRVIELNLGNGYDFGERGGSMPLFNATYQHQGQAQCRAR